MPIPFDGSALWLAGRVAGSVRMREGLCASVELQRRVLSEVHAVLGELEINCHESDAR